MADQKQRTAEELLAVIRAMGALAVPEVEPVVYLAPDDYESLICLCPVYVGQADPKIPGPLDPGYIEKKARFGGVAIEWGAHVPPGRPQLRYEKKEKS